MKTAKVRLEGAGLRLAALTGSGHRLVLDSADGDAGPRPIELLLVGLAGCTAMDVASILRKKRQPVDDYEVHLEGVQRTEHPAAFTDIEVRHVLRGAIDPAAIRRAIELSATRYCSASAALGSGIARIRHRFQLERSDDRTICGEVVVTGPRRDPDESEVAGAA